MKKIKFISAAILAACVALISCNKEQEVVEEVVTTATHTVRFVASQVETKTTMKIEDDKKAYFSWEKTDEDNVHIYESGEAGESIGILGDDGKMSFTATFTGSEAPADASYTAYVNSDITAQKPSADCYDGTADVLVAKTVTPVTPSTKADGRDVDFELSFEREVAVNKMTIKGLGASEAISSVTITSDKDIAGKYVINEWTEKTNSIKIVPDGVVSENGNAVVYFTCLPVENTQLTIDVTTGSGDNAKSYTKTFAKTITFEKGHVKTFGVTVNEYDPNLRTLSNSEIVAVMSASSITGDYGTYRDTCKHPWHNVT